MRRTVLLGMVVLLPGCTGFGEFINHTFTPFGENPNLPMADSENVRRGAGPSGRRDTAHTRTRQRLAQSARPRSDSDRPAARPGHRERAGFRADCRARRRTRPSRRTPAAADDTGQLDPAWIGGAWACASAAGWRAATAAVLLGPGSRAAGPNRADSARASRRRRRNQRLPPVDDAGRGRGNHGAERQRHEHDHQPERVGPDHSDTPLMAPR